MMGEVIRVSGRAPDVGEFLREAMLSQRFADVALCCPGGQRFLAHRLVLSAVSPYLQEVLLAHSKSTGHCEPITVILAEIEAPELAAILGFVYTGSATVPRPRLEAFLRAAEALHIRLPPVPIVMTRGKKSDDCKEDVKDVKINPKYLQCEQYPSFETWHRGVRSREDSGEKKDDRGISEVSQFPGPLHEQQDFSKFGPRPQYSSGVWPGEHRVEQDDHDHRHNHNHHHHHHHHHHHDESSHKSQLRFPTESVSMMPIDMPSPAERLTELRPPCGPGLVNEDPAKSYHDLCPPRRVDDFGLDPLEARLADYGHRLPATSVPGKVDDVLLAGRSPIDGSFPESDRVQVRGQDRAQDPDPVSFAQEVPAQQYANSRTRFEKRDYGEPMGEDLSCGEGCCRWRAPKRQVANRVTASPWRQIVRPHHSPKIRSTPMRCHADETEAERVTVQESPRLPSQPVSGKDHHSPNPMRNEAYYAFDVPTPSELTFCNNVRPLEAAGVPDARMPDYYKPGIPYPTAQPQPVPAMQNELRSGEPYYPTTATSIHAVHPAHPPVLTPGPEESAGSGKPASNVIKHVQASTYVAQMPQTPTKPEISHPVSRLCDTVEDDKKVEVVLGPEVAKPEEERKEEKIVPGVFMNSDSNNNDAIVGAQVEANQRGARAPGAQEDHRCDQCGKTFVTRASLKVHSRTHSGEKPFRCADCGKQFSQLRNYKYHRSVHEGTREFAATCPECGKYFNDRGYLSSHMKIHRNRKEYGCAECGKSFNQRVAYNMHVRIHTGVKPHQCEQCGKAFSRKMLLKQHLRTHSGERPYQCQVCQKAFADRSNMTLHTRLHSGLKPYQCTLCSKAFTKKHHLKTHLNYHTGTKPYSCSNCGLRFSQSSNMRTHFKKCTVNNPGGLKTAEAGGVNGSADSKDGLQVRGSTETLTPPNSDQESSILTPISKNPPVEGR